MFYDNFLNLCAAHDVSQADVARAIGISSAAISKWKDGGTPRDVTIAKLCNFFSVSKDELLEEKPAAKSDELTFDDFTYALRDEAEGLTEENKQKLLEMAKFFKQQQEKGNK